MSDERGLSDGSLPCPFLSIGPFLLLRISGAPAREVTLIPKIPNNSGGMLIESVPVGLLATRRFDIAAARNAERISTLQRTVWNLERLIFFLSSIRIPSQLPVRTRPAIKIKKETITNVPINIP